MRSFALIERLVISAAVASGNAASDLNFLVMGDWGGAVRSPYTTSGEVKTAKAMDTAASQLGAKFALALGDNFYNKGVKSVSDSRFQETFEQCFSGDSLSSANDFTFHILAGNHDHWGTVQAQVDYTAHSERWSFPSLYYNFNETTPDGAVVEFVMIDTYIIAGNSQVNDEDTNSLRGSELPGPPNLEAADAQMNWIKQTLESSTADYLIVAGHYPVFSIMEHGPTEQIQPSNFPHMRNNKVSAYLCGHDHGEQHIDVGDGIQYHVIGSAHGGDSSTEHAGTLSKGQLKFHSASNGGFATVSASKSGMQIKHLDASGKVLYTAPVILPRGASPTPAPVPTPAPSPTPSPGGLDTLAAESNLASGGKLVAAGGDVKLVVQKSDGNLVLYYKGKDVWSAKTSGNPGAYLVLQASDGNLVLYSQNKKALWSSGKNSGATKAVVQDDCDLVLMDDNGQTLWSVGTSCPAAEIVL